jgi:dihydrofolate reductase
MSRRLRYQVAVSLDGYIAGPHGEHDWIAMDPAIDVAALSAEFDTAVMGRRLTDAGLVDTVEVAAMPVLLGAGVPLVPPGAATQLALADQRLLPATGIVALTYAVPGGVGAAPRLGHVRAADSPAGAPISPRG